MIPMPRTRITLTKSNDNPFGELMTVNSNIARIKAHKYMFHADKRKFQDLALLMKQKRLTKAASIRCILREAHSNILAEGDSSAENMQPAAFGPNNQLYALTSLHQKIQGDQTFAATRYVTPQAAEQRVNLATETPALLDAYSGDCMTLYQLIASSAYPNHNTQMHNWTVISSA